MAPAPTTPRRTARGRPRGRPKALGSASASRSTRAAPDGPATEPPPKRRRYIPGGPGGGGRFVDEDGTEIPTEPHGPSTTASRPRASAASRAQPTPTVYPRRERSTRIRTAVNRDERDDMMYSSAAAVAAAVVQSEGYKPREERGWEEFHPNLDIEGTFMVYQADEVDGVLKSIPPTPAAQPSGAATPTKENNSGLANETGGTPAGGEGNPSLGGPLDTPSRRRVGRPPRDSISLYATRSFDFSSGPKVPKVLPIHGQTSKERLDLKQPQYRKTNRIALFESKTFGQARYVDKSMMNVGYQESDNFIRPDRNLIKATDGNMEEEAEQQPGVPKADADAIQHSAGAVGRVEYDMDEQDDMWLEKLNAQRKLSDLDPITREVFEIAITKIEKEWHALEKRIPKPNPKPPQTHRPRSSSAAAVNGEPQAGEEQDSKCAICDDGDCENTNAIVFCDGCDLAVHQECYGVPFIPEGQWLCRKCQLIGRGIPTCIFCPNTDGAFKQTNSSKWAHLLCAMWIPEVSLGNHTFMEPVMEVEKVPKTRWRLSCYICNQRMGACIQCSNKNCYQAFHVTCARRCRLFLKMKNSQGALAVLDGTLPLKAFCDKHCPPDYAEENAVAQATRDAKRFYKRTMKGRIWADSQASALQIAATHRNAITEHPPDESQMTGAKVSAVLTADKKKGQPLPKNVWKLPSGAPVIPQAVYDLVESALARFPIRKRKDFVAEACKYWTLKREARRGAALLKRLQLQMETFSSMELTRRNFAAMGPSGKARLARRIDFCRTLIQDLAQLKDLSDAVVQREEVKLEAAEIEQDFVDTCYFPIFKELQPILDKAFFLDKNVFQKGFQTLQDKLDERVYTTTLHFVRDLCQAVNAGINEPSASSAAQDLSAELLDVSPSKNNHSEATGRRRLGKRILKLLQPHLESALRAEADICGKPVDALQKEFEAMLEASLEVRQRPVTRITVSDEKDAVSAGDEDVDMLDAPEEGQIVVAHRGGGEEDAEGEPDDAVSSAHAGEETNIEVGRFDGEVPKPNGTLSSTNSLAGDHVPLSHKEAHLTNGFGAKPASSASPPSLPGASYTHNPATANNNSNNPSLSVNAPLTPPPSHDSGSFASASGFPANNRNNNNTNNPSAPPSTFPIIITTTTPSDPSSTSSSASSTSSALQPHHQQKQHSQPQPQHHPHQRPQPQDKQQLESTATVNATTPLTQGGVAWYLAGFELRGTSAAEERWTTGREALRSLSEELTDMDEEALRDLEFDVDEENTITISGDGGQEEDGDGDGEEDQEGGDGDSEVEGDGEGDGDGIDGNEGGGAENGSARKARGTRLGVGLGLGLKNGGGGGLTTPTALRKGRSGGLGAAGGSGVATRASGNGAGGRFSLRKGVRSSARRR